MNSHRSSPSRISAISAPTKRPVGSTDSGKEMMLLEYGHVDPESFIKTTETDETLHYAFPVQGRNYFDYKRNEMEFELLEGERGIHLLTRDTSFHGSPISGDIIWPAAACAAFFVLGENGTTYLGNEADASSTNLSSSESSSGSFSSSSVGSDLTESEEDGDESTSSSKSDLSPLSSSESSAASSFDLFHWECECPTAGEDLLMATFDASDDCSDVSCSSDGTHIVSNLSGRFVLDDETTFGHILFHMALDDRPCDMSGSGCSLIL